MGGWVEVNCDDKLQGGSHVPSSDLRYPAGILSCSVVHTCMFPFVMCRNKGTPPQRRSKQQELDAVLMACEGGELDPVSRTKVMGGTFTASCMLLTGAHQLSSLVLLPCTLCRCWWPVRGYTPMPFPMLPFTLSRRQTVCDGTLPPWNQSSQRGPSPQFLPPSCHKTSPSVNQSCREARPLQPTGSECPSQTSQTRGMLSSQCCGRTTPNQAQPAAGRSTRGGGGGASLWLGCRRCPMQGCVLLECLTVQHCITAAAALLTALTQHTQYNDCLCSAC